MFLHFSESVLQKGEKNSILYGNCNRREFLLFIVLSSWAFHMLFFCFCICLPLCASLSLHLSLSLYLLLSLFLHLSLCFVPSTLSIYLVPFALSLPLVPPILSHSLSRSPFSPPLPRPLSSSLSPLRSFSYPSLSL